MSSEIKLAGMTNIFQANRGTNEKTTIVDCMRRLRKFGYDKMDLGLGCMLYRDCYLHSPDWEKMAYEIREEAERLGVKFVQGHLPFRWKKFNPKDPKDLDFMADSTLRAIKIASICGVEWMVAHPVEDPDYPEEAIEEHVKENLRIYEPVMEVAHKGNVGITFENVPRWSAIGRFGSTATDLIHIIDTYNDSLVQACWDFGHANLVYGDLQPYGIRKLGKRLKTVHVQDNKGSLDDHFCPYAGKIKWEECFRALKEIGFDGYWTFEVILQNNFPDKLKDSSVEFTTHVAKTMIEEYNALTI